MSKKIMGVTVGTPISPSKIENEIKPVKTVNGVEPDENGNVEVSGGNGATFRPSVSTDGVLSWTNDKGLDNPESVNIKGTDGKDGKDGYNGFSPTVIVTKSGKETEIYINDANGAQSVTILDGADGKDGTNGKDGANGKDGINGKDGTNGVSATHSWNGTTLTITSASGTSSANLKGEKGDKGEQGIQGEKGDKGDTGAVGPQGGTGAKGDKGDKGDSYTLTEADKAEIAEMVDGATLVQAPKYVDSVEEMTDTSRVYVMASTGKIWAYMDTTIEKDVTLRDDIIGTTDNPYQTGRLSSGGDLSSDVTTHTLTPYIDLTKPEYEGKTIQLHLEGNRYVTETQESYIQMAIFKADKTVISGRTSTCLDKTKGILPVLTNVSTVINGDTSATLTITIPAKYNGTTIELWRFCGLGTVKDSVYITYTDKRTVSGSAWIDTGTSYSPSISNEDLNTIAEQAASIVDNNLLSFIGSGEVSV